MRTFDAGCGNGAFSIFAAHTGNEVVAASFSEQEQESARRRAEMLDIDGIDFRIIDLRELESHRDSLGMFDQIICLETIEHVGDDQGLVQNLSSMLKPGGRSAVEHAVRSSPPAVHGGPASRARSKMDRMSATAIRRSV